MHREPRSRPTVADIDDDTRSHNTSEDTGLDSRDISGVIKYMTKPWKCPACKRQFTRPNQRHACGTGDRATVLRNRPPELVAVYGALEAFVSSLGPVEFVARDRYVLFRTTRIFADVVVMVACIRLAIHLPSKVEHASFSKIVADHRHVTHVALLQHAPDVEAVESFLREAYAFSLR